MGGIELLATVSVIASTLSAYGAEMGNEDRKHELSLARHPCERIRPALSLPRCQSR
jgi:hypothetical protein